MFRLGATCHVKCADLTILKGRLYFAHLLFEQVTLHRIVTACLNKVKWMQ